MPTGTRNSLRSIPPNAPSSPAVCKAICRRRPSPPPCAVKDSLAATPKEIATRTACEFALESLIPALPEMIGGSADLTGSNNTRTKSMNAMSAADYSGRFIHYGVREHRMASRHERHGAARRHHPVQRHVPGVLRLLPASHSPRRADGHPRHPHHATHNSIGLGEDGPTHEPVEHLARCAIPNLLVFRPCDAVETLECWQLAFVGLYRGWALTRQNSQPEFPREQPLRRRRI